MPTPSLIPPRRLPALLFFSLSLLLLPLAAQAQVSLPNGTVSEVITDLKVQTVSGPITVDRQFLNGHWRINTRWEPMELTGEAIADATGREPCRAWREVKIQERSYTGDSGVSWMLENRYSARATDYYPGENCEAERIRGIRWLDRTTGNWMDYRRSDPGQLRFQLTRYGDRYGTVTQLERDEAGRLLRVKDHHGNIVLEYEYTGDKLTALRDNPQLLPGNSGPAREVRYTYGTTTNGENYAILSEVTDVLGNVTRYAYDGPRLTSLTDPEGRIRRYAWLGDRISQYTDAEGNVTAYAYDYDRSKREYRVRITHPETEAGQRIVEERYDEDGRLIGREINGKTVYRRTRLDNYKRNEESEDSAGRKTRTEKNEFGQIVRTIHPDGTQTQTKYSAVHGQIIEETDELGIKTRYDYDASGKLIKKTEAAGTAEERITEYEIDGYGRASKITRKGGSITLPNGQTVPIPDAVTTYQYDERGNQVQITDPEGNVTRYEHDLTGAVTTMIDPLGRRWETKCDAAGRILTQTDPLGNMTRYGYDKAGNLTSVTDASGNTTTYAYDRLNRLTRITDPLGGIHKLDYDALGLPIAETDADDRKIQVQYDRLQRLSRLIDGAGHPTQYGYTPNNGGNGGNEAGILYQPTETQYPTLTEQRHYDKRGRPIRQTLRHPARQGMQTLESTIAYDKRGQVTQETDPYGKTHQYTWNAHGQLVETTDTLGNITRAAYDVRGNLIQLTDAQGNAHRFAYDKNDRLIQETRPLGQTTQYAYDAVGHLSEKTHPNGDRETYTHDTAGRLTETKHERNGQTQVARIVTQTWDANNRLTAWSDTDTTRPAGQQQTQGSATYDDENRKTGETITWPTPEGGTYSLGYQYAYSPAGKKIKLTWPDGTEIDYGYSPHGELQSVTIPGEGKIEVGQFKWLVPERITLPGGAVLAQTHDGLLQPETSQVTTQDQRTPLVLENTWGKNQELKERARTDLIGDDSATRNESYTYDDELRLTQTKTDTGGLFGTTAETFTLDAVANRTRHSKIDGAWTYDANNRLIQRGEENDATTYQYDANGNLRQKSEGGEGNEGAKVTRYTYDAQNRLIEVADASAGAEKPIARYGYDPQNRRLWKEQYADRAGNPLTPAKRTYFLYADEGLIAEATQDITLNPDGSVTATNPPQITRQYGIKPDNPFTTGVLFVKTKDANGQQMIAYYHHDHLQIPIQATDKQGRVVWAATYDAFGRASIQTQPTENQAAIESLLRLPGQIEDEETGLHYNWNRYYDPETGRYITQDIIGIKGGGNFYLYAEANPMMYTDPSGEIGIPGAIGGAAFSIGMQMLICNRLGGDLYTCFKCINLVDVVVSGMVGFFMPTWLGNVGIPMTMRNGLVRRVVNLFGMRPEMGQIPGLSLGSTAKLAASGTAYGTVTKSILPSRQIECEDVCAQYRWSATGAMGFATSLF